PWRSRAAHHLPRRSGPAPDRWLRSLSRRTRQNRRNRCCRLTRQKELFDLFRVAPAAFDRNLTLLERQTCCSELACEHLSATLVTRRHERKTRRKLRDELLGTDAFDLEA